MFIIYIIATDNAYTAIVVMKIPVTASCKGLFSGLGQRTCVIDHIGVTWISEYSDIGVT